MTHPIRHSSNGSLWIGYELSAQSGFNQFKSSHISIGQEIYKMQFFVLKLINYNIH
jgi:hypothetical protein